jgi:hypothetical protein
MMTHPALTETRITEELGQLLGLAADKWHRPADVLLTAYRLQKEALRNAVDLDTWTWRDLQLNAEWRRVLRVPEGQMVSLLSLQAYLSQHYLDVEIYPTG